MVQQNISRARRLWAESAFLVRCTILVLLPAFLIPFAKELLTATQKSFDSPARNKPVRNPVALFFLPNGLLCVNSSREGTRLINPKTGDVLRRLPRLPMAVLASNGLAATPYEIGSRDSSAVAIWDIKTGKVTKRLPAFGDVTYLAFSSDKAKLLAVSRAFESTPRRGRPFREQWVEVRVWNVRTGTVIGKRTNLNRMGGGGMWVVLSGDTNKITTWGVDNSPRIWHSWTGKFLRNITLGDKGDYVDCLTVSPDGKVIVGSNASKGMQLYNGKTGEKLRALRGHHGNALDLVFSPDSKRLAGQFYGAQLVVWDVASGAILREYGRHRGPSIPDLSSIAFSPDGKFLASGYMDGKVKIRKL